MYPRTAVLAALFTTLPLAACKGHRSEVAPGTLEGPVSDAAVLAAVVDEPREAIDAGTGVTTVRIAALESPTPINSAPEWPPKDPTKASDERAGVIRLGYLRKGQVVEAKASIIKKANCPEGWFELTTGGFVCGKTATMDLSAKALADAPHAPFTDQPLPYDYGLNLTNGAPAYRRYPTRVERKQYEANLAVGKAGGMDAKAEPSGGGEEGAGGTPWYLKDHAGSPRPQVSLDELHDSEGPVKERMVRGFYVALDAPVHKYSGKFWRTTHGLWVPADFLLVHKASTEFEGTALSDSLAASPRPDASAASVDGSAEDAAAAPAEPKKLPLAWALALHTRQYRPTPDGKMKRGPHVDRFTAVTLTGNHKAVEDRNYYETTDGWWLRDIDGTMTKPGPPPKELVPGEKWIDVNITTQTLVAYEGDKPVFATLISSGRHDDKDPTKDHKTKQGSFRIREKHVAATMDADSSTDGPYSIQDVPWIMYFEGSYALHGAFWHLSFGHERSHGCVNLMPKDAHTLFGWTGPKLPEGWHGVRATQVNPGTRVIVHE
jgi:hypothetical protein